ncbi:MAG: hypothetical protein D6715_13310 [Calditrichaeota bacterium]|nr:MAG: hypothetical protein D6715_13310 [Calditrichota bacterium]
MIELAQAIDLETFVIDNSHAQEDSYSGISARAFELQTSTSSPTDGYRQILAGEAGKGIRKAFRLPRPARPAG